MPDLSLPALPATGRRVTPTDVAQFIRLDQCERYLRLQLASRHGGQRFLRDYDVAPQAIPPLLTQVGRTFEKDVEAAIAAAYPSLNLAQAATVGARRAADNAAVVETVRALAAGETRVLFQPRLAVGLGDWQVTGDIDILRLDRDAAGELCVLIADTKTSTAARVEHRLQVAFYHAMLSRLLGEAGWPPASVEIGVLYRGPVEGEGHAAPDPAVDLTAQRGAARERLGVENAYLEVLSAADAQAFLDTVSDLVSAPDSTAARVADTPFDDLPFHLTYKCDGCLFNELCLKWATEHDDLSLLPYLTMQDKIALRRLGLTTTQTLATLKDLPPRDANGRRGKAELLPAQGREDEVRAAARAWPVGPRVDELVVRARRYRKYLKENIDSLDYIPHSGHTSLPYSDATHNPNLVRVFIDAQHDYLHDRVYLLGALVVANEAGLPARRNAIVEIADEPPTSDAAERELLVRWVEDTVRAVIALAAPDAEGQRAAPIHLVFYDSYAQSVLLDALGRHGQTVLGATPLYDFMTQLAAYDSPISSFLEAEIREHQNYPMLCQTLHSVAAFTRFDWNAPQPFRDLFYTRVFDSRGHRNDDPEARSYYTRRARFNSQIPLEYAYHAWGALPIGDDGKDDFAGYRKVDLGLVRAFAMRRLDAMEHLAGLFHGNQLTEKKPFALPDLSHFDDKARSLAQSLAEFVSIERHTALGQWKATRHAPAARRVLMGETLLARYDETLQEPGVAERNRENERRRLQRLDLRANGATLSKEQRAETGWDQRGMRVRLRIVTDGLDCDLDTALTLWSIKEGDYIVVYPTETVDERLPVEQRTPNAPTPRQMLYGTRAEVVEVQVERDTDNRATAAAVTLRLTGGSGSSDNPAGFLFGPIERPLVADTVYTLDSDPNDIYGFWGAKVVQGLCELETGKAQGRNALYERLARPDEARAEWPQEAALGQARFLRGLVELHAHHLLHDFEASKHEFIGEHGDSPSLLVQGPPGTGKSYTAAFALFARMQGAMAAGRPFRAQVTCKTHRATDVLLENVLRVRNKLADIAAAHPDLFDAHFDRRLLNAPLLRLAGKEASPDGVVALAKDADKEKGARKNWDILHDASWEAVAATPGGVYRLVKDRKGGLFVHHSIDCLVLDEASQMNLPEAAMAALPLKPNGQLIVVGDHRQMPPIVQHDWDNEPRRTFREYKAYESLFDTLLATHPPMIRFEESFRVHHDHAEFLRREIYSRDGIDYFSRKHATLADCAIGDPFVAAVLSPGHPLVVVVHAEADSQTRNPFEERLVGPLLDTLVQCYGLDAHHGLGVVVPHRAQRAALIADYPFLTVVDEATGALRQSAVDTVERFQGGERDVILVSATESNREYLLAAGDFLLDPRRLTVALSRAKKKMVLVASRSVFNLFSANEATFEKARLWKNLLRHTCTQPLWAGQRDGVAVEVWGNAASGSVERGA